MTKDLLWKQTLLQALDLLTKMENSAEDSEPKAWVSPQQLD